MKISASKAVAAVGLCALFAGAGTAAFAQGYDHPGQRMDQTRHDQIRHDQIRVDQTRQDRRSDQHRQTSGTWYQDPAYRQSTRYRQANLSERRRLDRLHAVYAHEVAGGHYGAAEKAHLHAQAIRAHLRAQRGQ